MKLVESKGNYNVFVSNQQNKYSSNNKSLYFQIKCIIFNTKLLASQSKIPTR